MYLTITFTKDLGHPSETWSALRDSNAPLGPTIFETSCMYSNLHDNQSVVMHSNCTWFCRLPLVRIVNVMSRYDKARPL